MGGDAAVSRLLSQAPGGLDGAVMAVLWFAYPRYRPLYIVPVVAVIVGLVGADFHFVSDIIAGGFIGASTGWIFVVFWQTYFLAAPAAKSAKKVRKK